MKCCRCGSHVEDIYEYDDEVYCLSCYSALTDYLYENIKDREV